MNPEPVNGYAKRLKDEFSHLSIMVLLDGLYPNGPIIEVCRKNRWDFMIVLQDKRLPSVWAEYKGLKKLETNNHFNTTWGDRKQRFDWVNNIDYYYGPNEKKKQTIHVVVCKERWKEIAKDSAEVIKKESRHAWISSKPLCRGNVHERCNLGARHRWSIESSILVEKRHGYHYLMRLGRFINVLAHNSESFIKRVRELGVRGFIRFIRNTISGPWLEPEYVRKRIADPFQLRLT
ncbi:MAG: hypothetical protein JRF37_05910 [Deltaproteobacteria bacterium]|nr:hypothetical protein [Deltaproteobacteria bacterium]